MRASHLIVVMAAIAALLAGCGNGGSAETETPPQDMRQFRVTITGKPRPENVGFILAKAQGYLGEAGLEVIVHTPLTPARPLGYAAKGIVDVSVTPLPELVLAQDSGADVVAVASVITEPTTAMIWLRKSKIDDLADLKGKTVAIQGLHYERRFLEAFLARAGLTLADVKVEVVEEELAPALVSGRADAILGPWNMEGAELEARGLEPVITRVQSLGLPPYEELVLVVSRERLSKDPQSIRDFISAMTRGNAAAREDPEAAVAAVAYRIGEEPGKKTTAEFDATLPLLSESGEMSEEKAGQLVDWMREEGLIESELPVSELLTNEYLPQP